MVIWICGGGANGCHGIKPFGGFFNIDNELNDLAAILRISSEMLRYQRQYVSNAHVVPLAEGALPATTALTDIPNLSQVLYLIPSELLSHTRRVDLQIGCNALRTLLLDPRVLQDLCTVIVYIEAPLVVTSSRWADANPGARVNYALSPEEAWRQVVQGPALQAAGLPLHLCINQ